MQLANQQSGSVTDRDRGSSFTRGLLVALCGTAAVSACESLERRWLGREPRYSAMRVAGRTGARGSEQRALAHLMRWSYGPLLGLLANRLLGGSRRGAVTEALAVAAGVSALEALVMPRSGAVEPLSRWPARERATFLLHTFAFGAGVAAARQLV